MKQITEIISRKKVGLDCNENESAFIKGWLKDTIILTSDGTQQILEDIQIHFPLEYGEYLDGILDPASPEPAKSELTVTIAGKEYPLNLEQTHVIFGGEWRGY